MEEKLKILYWADFKLRCSKNLIREINKYLPNAEFTILENIWDVLSPNFDLELYDVIIIQVTDVTKFSSNENERTAICEKLEEFVYCNKKLIVTHDAIYRRTRNEILQEMYGYVIKNFTRQNNVRYHKTSYCNKTDAFASLNSTFDIADGEICWGDVSSLNDKMVFFETTIQDMNGKNVKVPLVFGKVYNGGQILWLNTGDTFEDPPLPIVNLDKNYINLLVESIKIDLLTLSSKEAEGDSILQELHKCDMDKPYSFICYSNENKKRVYENCLILDKLGVNYYLDYKNITSQLPGTQGWKECVNAAIANPNCKSAYIFISEELLQSNNCYFEIMKIIEDNKIIPIILSVGLDNEKILNIIEEWPSFTYLEKISTFKKLLSIEANSLGKLSINNLVYHAHRDLRHFKNDVQFLQTVHLTSNISIDEITSKVNEIIK